MNKVNFVRRLFYNWHIKLISLAVAFILWKYVDSLNEKEKYLNVRLTIKTIPEGYVVVNKVPEYVKILIKGKEEILSAVDSSDFIAFVNPGNYPGNYSKLPVQVEERNVPRGIVVKDINPSFVKIKIEKSVEKKVLVEPVIVGKPKKGYFIEDIILNPTSVRIKGALSVISEINEIYTKEIDITNLSLTAGFHVKLKTQGLPNIKIVGKDYVNVIIKVSEKYVLLNIKNVKLKFLNLNPGLKPEPEDIFIDTRVRVPDNLKNSISESDVLAFVDCKAVTKPGKYILPVHIKTLKKQVEITAFTPEEVKVEIKSYNLK